MAKFDIYEGRLPKEVCNPVSIKSTSKEKPSKHKGWQVGFESLSAHNKNAFDFRKAFWFLNSNGLPNYPEASISFLFFEILNCLGFINFNRREGVVMASYHLVALNKVAGNGSVFITHGKIISDR